MWRTFKQRFLCSKEKLQERTVRLPSPMSPRGVLPAQDRVHLPGQVGRGCNRGHLAQASCLQKSSYLGLSTVSPIEVWMFKIQFVKCNPLKYTSIFTSLLSCWVFFFKSKRSLTILKMAQFCLILGKQAALIIDKRSEAQTSHLMHARTYSAPHLPF